MPESSQTPAPRASAGAPEQKDAAYVRTCEKDNAAAPLRVVEIDPLRDSRWEPFVASHPDGLIFHHPLWLKAIELSYGHRAVAFACEDLNGHFHGVLPLCHTRGLLSGSRLISLPHTPLAGPLASEKRATAALVKAAIAWVHTEGKTRLELKLPCSGLEAEVNNVAGLPWEETYILDLPSLGEHLHFGNSRNHARLKWAVNKAAKLGVHVRCAAAKDDLRRWYLLYLETMRRHAVPPRPYRFFETAWDLLQEKGLMHLFVAEQQRATRSDLLAGSIFLSFGQTVFYAFNGRHRPDLALRPNDSIQWEALRYFWNKGFRRYDFGEVSESNHGLAEFKMKWGARPRRLFRYYYPAPPKLELKLFCSTGLLRRITNAAWQALPLRATVTLGRWLYRSL
jgi:GNAT acetyltransferase-like protein